MRRIGNPSLSAITSTDKQGKQTHPRLLRPRRSLFSYFQKNCYIELMEYKTLKGVAASVRQCADCPLHKNITNYVPGEGSGKSGILFIGEGPGKDEDLQGRPFVGRSGQILRTLIREEAKLREEDVFIANVVKCRPPDNRDPRPEEIKTCWKYLEAQINILKPKLIATLGRHSMGRFLPGLTISKVHGKIFRSKSGQYYLPLFHPAVACYSPSKLDEMKKDFRKIPKILEKIEKSLP